MEAAVLNFFLMPTSVAEGHTDRHVPDNGSRVQKASTRLKVTVDVGLFGVTNRREIQAYLAKLPTTAGTRHAQGKKKKERLEGKTSRSQR